MSQVMGFSKMFGKGMMKNACLAKIGVLLQLEGEILEQNDLYQVIRA